MIINQDNIKTLSDIIGTSITGLILDINLKNYEINKRNYEINKEIYNINYDILNKSNNPKFKHVCELAEKWLNKKSLSHKHLEEGNNILYEYLQTVIENKLNRDEEFEIYPGFDMVLTRQDILKNKEYFNALFRKFDIDYQISDSFCSAKTS